MDRGIKATWIMQLVLALPLLAQSNSGEMRLRVLDADGLGLKASVELVCEANQIHNSYVTTADGNLAAKNLPFGLYRFQVTSAGFTSYSGSIEIRSAVPTDIKVQLRIATQEATITVNAETLVDPHRVGTVNRAGTDTLEHASIALPGRSVIDLINSQPGWLLEANGVLHPRGSEYQTQCRFPISQDQRNTVSSRFRYQVLSRLWTAFGGSYGSGLPIEFDGTEQDAVQQFGQQILNRINFDRSRVRPSLALNASVGLDLLKDDNISARLQADVQNLNNRINVINFAGLFSGTAIAPPRSYALRLVTEF